MLYVFAVLPLYVAHSNELSKYITNYFSAETLRITFLVSFVMPLFEGLCFETVAVQ